MTEGPGTRVPNGLTVRSRPVPFEIWKTRNGPIFADVDLEWDAPPTWLSPEDRPAEEKRAYSLRWETSGDIATAFEAINRATDWTTFTTAVGSFATPSMNIVYADIDGNIGYSMSGRLPVREPQKTQILGMGMLTFRRSFALHPAPGGVN